MDQSEIMLFDVYFAGVVSMAHCHPGSGRSNGYGTAAPRLTLQECADLVIEMLKVRRQVMAQHAL